LNKKIIPNSLIDTRRKLQSEIFYHWGVFENKTSFFQSIAPQAVIEWAGHSVSRAANFYGKVSKFKADWLEIITTYPSG